MRVCELGTSPQYEGDIIQRRGTDHDVSIDKNTNTLTNPIMYEREMRNVLFHSPLSASPFAILRKKPTCMCGLWFWLPIPQPPFEIRFRGRRFQRARGCTMGENHSFWLLKRFLIFQGISGDLDANLLKHISLKIQWQIKRYFKFVLWVI